MSRKKKSKSNVGRQFALFVKPVDSDGFIIESDCGWLKLSPETELVFSLKEAMVFTEKEEGHGSYSDWKQLFEEDHPNWRINPPVYLDEVYKS